MQGKCCAYFGCFITIAFSSILYGQPGTPSGAPPVLDQAKFAAQTVWVPYWSEKDGHRSLLHLRNALHHNPLQVTIDVYSQQGVVLATRSASLAKLANLDLPLQSVISSGAADSARAGSIRVSYSYPNDGVLQAELSIRDDTRNHSYTIVGRKPYKSASPYSYLAIYRPTADTYLEMAFTNPSAEKAVTANLSIRQGDTWKALTSISLKPANTEKVRIAAETLSAAVSSTAREALLIRAEFSVSSTEVIANGWMEDEKTGFSNTALFHDTYPNSNSLYATQLVLGAFPETAWANGPRFDGELVFVNVGAAASTLSAKLYCASEGTMTSLVLPPQTLEPFTVNRVDLASIAAGKVDSGRGAICSAEFSYTGTPGHVIGRYYAASTSKTYGVYVKLEPFTGWAYSEVYWTVEWDFVPLLTVANFSAEKDTIEVYVSEADSITLLYSQEVAPFGSFTVNLRELMKPLQAEKKFKADFGGLYIKTVRPTGKLLVKQHAVSGRRLMMAPYYGSYDYIQWHYFGNVTSPLDLGGQGSASVTTCYSISGCRDNDWFIYSNNPSIASVTNTYGVFTPRPVLAQASGSTTLDSTASGIVDSYGNFGYLNAAPAQVQVRQPTLTCTPGTVTRASNVTCQLSGVVAGRVTGWQFSGSDLAVSGPSATTSWSGPMVARGTVTATFNGAQSVFANVNVTNRTNFAFAAASPTKRTVGYNCGGGISLSIDSEPTGGGNDTIGAYCIVHQASFTTGTVPSGPNSGIQYVTSIASSNGGVPTAFNWALNSHLDAQSGAFHSAQCGNWNGSTGFISAANLRANTIRHEADTSSQSHWINYRDAQNSPSNNLGVAAESFIGTGPLFISDVQDLLGRKMSAINTAAGVEPLGVNFSSIGTFQGPVNFRPYQPCN